MSDPIQKAWEEYYGEPIDDGLGEPYVPAPPPAFGRGFVDGVEHATLKSINVSSAVQTAFVFAARYVHHRKTGGTLAITVALGQVWDYLSDQTQQQILSESEEATANLEDWENFRKQINQ